MDKQQRIAEVKAAIASVMESLTADEFGEAAQINTENGGGLHLLAVPGAFWNDHQSRDLNFGAVEVRSSAAEWGYTPDTYAVVLLSDEELAELESDARHYAFGYGEEYEELMESARRLTIALWSQAPAFMLDRQAANPLVHDLAWALDVPEYQKGAIITA